MATPSIPPIEVKSETLSDDILLSKYLSLSIASYVSGIYSWQPADTTLKTTFNGKQPISFEAHTIDLPTAAQRWSINISGHPEMTFDDLREGNLPEPTDEELEARRKAIELAKGVHEQLDIRPLKTSTIIRMLREGREK